MFRTAINSILCLSALSSIAPAQTVHIVDITGRNGRFTTITAAVAAARSGDTILVYPGKYTGRVDVNNKALSIVGISGHGKDVVIDLPANQAAALRVRNNPAGTVSRFAHLSLIVAGQPTAGSVLDALVVGTSRGHLIFQDIQSHGAFILSGVKGSVSLKSCLVKVGSAQGAFAAYVVRINNVDHTFVHGGAFLAATPNFSKGGEYPCFSVTGGTLEMTQASLKGSDGPNFGCLRSPHGGPALVLHNCTARVNGASNSVLEGGKAAGFACSNIHGGAAISLLNSSLGWFGVSLVGGQGPSGRAPAIKADAQSRVHHNLAAIPLLVPSGNLVVGTQQSVGISAWPNALSLTWIALELAPLPNPLGVLAPDLAGPHASIYLWHNVNGNVTLNLDLRNLPVSLVGRHYVIQTVAVDARLAGGLSSPLVGVLSR